METIFKLISNNYLVSSILVAFLFILARFTIDTYKKNSDSKADRKDVEIKTNSVEKSIRAWVSEEIDKLRDWVERQMADLKSEMRRLEERLEKKLDQGFKEIRHERANKRAAEEGVLMRLLEVADKLERRIENNG